MTVALMSKHRATHSYLISDTLVSGQILLTCLGYSPEDTHCTLNLKVSNLKFFEMQ